ncbi:MAG: nucleotidyltransferase family protein [Candidatus Aenigmatarchaeota archaeon]
MKRMPVFILAGGYGTRMQPYSQIIPKCLLPVAGKPCVRWIVERFLSQGFNNITICINEWMVDQFEFAFRDLNIKFSITPHPVGTLNELRNALSKYNKKIQKFFLQYGDDLTQVDYLRVVKYHENKKSDVTLVTTKNVNLEFGIVKVDKENKVIEFMEKPKVNKPIWTSVSIFDEKAIECFNSCEGNDIASDLFPYLIRKGLKVYSYEISSPWVDIGNIFHYIKANELMKEK